MIGLLQKIRLKRWAVNAYQPTYGELRGLTLDTAQDCGKDKVKALLREYGVERLNELDDKYFKEFKHKLQQLK